MRFKLAIYKLFMAMLVILSGILNCFRKYKAGNRVIKNVNYSPDKLKKCTYDILINKNATPDKSVIIYFHGGGFVSGDKKLYHKICTEFASFSHIVINVNYPLAPKANLNDIISNCKLAVNSSLQNLKAVIEIPSKIILAGDSAGAYIATKLATEYNEQNNNGLLNISGIVGFYGVYDFDKFSKTNFFGKDLFLYALVGKDYKEKTYASINEFIKSVDNFPPMLIVSGEKDILHFEQSQNFYNELTKNGTKVESCFFDKSIKSARHGFLAYPNNKVAKQMPEIVDKFIESVV